MVQLLGQTAHHGSGRSFAHEEATWTVMHVTHVPWSNALHYILLNSSSQLYTLWYRVQQLLHAQQARQQVHDKRKERIFTQAR